MEPHTVNCCPWPKVVHDPRLSMTQGCPWPKGYFSRGCLSRYNMYSFNKLYSSGPWLYLYIADELLSPTFSPTKLKFPKHIHTPLDDKFKQLADSILSRSVEGGKEKVYEVSAPYEMFEYPIEEKETNSYFERQLSSRLVMWQLM